MLVKVCNQIVQAVPLTSKTAGMHEKKIIPVDTEGMRYLRFRAIGNFEVDGANGNWDSFPVEHFESEEPGYGYKSFIGKKAHLEHNSALGNAGSIGDLPDAYLNKFIYPDDVSEKKWASILGNKYNDKRASILSMPGQKDGAIEVLMRIDTNLVKSAKIDKKAKHLLDRIIRMIDTGQKLTCSMGSNIQFSVCSACFNTARFSSDYCTHLKPGRKGGLTIVSANDIRDALDKELLRPEWLKHLVASKFDVDEILKGSSKKGVAVRNAEINHKTSFFELSVVATPAFFRADQLEKLARLQSEDRVEYLKRIASDFNDEEVIELYSILQDRGLISNQCGVS